MKFGFKFYFASAIAIASLTTTFAEYVKPTLYEEIFTRQPKRQLYATELEDIGFEAYRAGNWNEAVKAFRTIAIFYPNEPGSKNAWFYTGVAYFEMEEYEKALASFDTYLKTEEAFFFDNVIEYKYYIAEQFRNGLKKRPFGLKKIPRFAPSSEAALELYENIIEIAPASELAARSLFGKGCILRQNREFREAIDTLNLLQRRFPKHELGPDCYLMQLALYYDLSIVEFQNPDVIAFAELTLNKFKQEYPREERIRLAEDMYVSIEESYAKGFYETGCFYERIGREKAAAIYYQTAIDRFPNTKTALACNLKLNGLAVSLPKKDNSSIDMDAYLDYNDSKS